MPRMVSTGVSDRLLTLLLLPFGLLCSATCHGQAAVHVQRRGETVVIDVDMQIGVAPAIAWGVLTDYDHMATFVSALTSSKVVDRQGETFHVAQAGRTKVAFMTFSFAAVRAIELAPMREIRSSLVSGDFKSYVSTTRLVWLPPIVGLAVIESATRKQFDAFSAQMLRRQAAQE